MALGRFAGRAVTMRPVSILLPDLRGGGAERVCVNIANELHARGHVMDVVVMADGGAFRPLLAPGVRVVNLGARRMRGAAWPLARYFRRERPKAMLACMWPLTTIAVWARKVAGVDTRVVVAEHTTWSRASVARRPVARCIVRGTMYASFPFADSVLAVSHGAGDDLARFAGLPRHRVTTIYNPVVDRPPPFPSGELPPPRWWSGAHRRLLAVGTLKPEKDYANLLGAFARVIRAGVDARLLILGEGSCRPELERLVQQMDLAPRVFMPGFVVDPSPYYAHAHLHVLSSLAEGLPTVVIEALAAGTPVVSTDCESGPREILANGKFGRLVPVGDPGALAHAIQVALGATHDLEALRARAQEFSIEKAVDQYERILSVGSDSV